MSLLLGDLEVGSTAKVVGFSKGDKAYRKKVLAMGLTKGTVFEVLRVAPLADPVEIKLRGFNLSLRKDEAASVIVEKEN